MKVHSVKTQSRKPEVDPKYNHLLPERTGESITFVLEDSNEAFANAVRRVFIDEVPIKYIDSPIERIKTSDDTISDLFLKARLAQVPLDQAVPENVKFSLYVENKGSESIWIRMSAVVASDKKSYFDGSIILCSLKPGKFLNISNAYITTGNGYMNGSMCLGAFKYRILDIKFNMSTVQQDNKNFQITLETNGQISVKDMVDLIASNMKTRAANISNIIMTKKATILRRDSMYDGTTVTIHEIHIEGEYHTMGNILMYYCLQVDPTLTICSYKLNHVLQNKIIFSIAADEKRYEKIIEKALTVFAEDVDTWQGLITEQLSL